MAKEDIHALAGAYALDAVDEVERAAFDRHLSHCRTCTAEVADLREVASRLADQTRAVPPVRLRENVVAEIARTQQARPVTLRPSSGVVLPPVRWRSFTAGAVAASILAVGAVAGTWAVQERHIRAEHAIAESARSETDRIHALLAAPDLQSRAVPLKSGGRVTITMSRSRNAGILTVSAVKPPPSGRAFQIWLIGTQAMPSTVLPAGAAADTVLVEGLAGNRALGITQEVATGAQKPSEVLASLSLS